MKKESLAFFLASLFWLGFFAFNAITIQRVDFDNDHWLEESNQHQQARAQFASEFELDENSIIIFPADDLFTWKRIAHVNAFSDLLRGIEGVNDIVSPLEANAIVNTEESLWIESYREALDAKIIKTPEDFKSQLELSPWYGKIISHDFSLATLIVKQDSLGNPNERTRIITEIKEKLAADDFFSQAVITGDAVLKDKLDQATKDELSFLLPLAGILLFIILYLLFGRLWKTVLVFFAAGLCSSTALAIMVLQGHHLTTISLILPIMLSVIAIADSLHILVFWNHLRKTMPELNRHQMLIKTFKGTWRPCFLTSVTSAFGFGMFYFSELIPFQDFASDAFFSILLAFPIMMGVLFTGFLVAPLDDGLAHIVQKYFEKLIDSSLEKFWLWGKHYSRVILFTAFSLASVALISLSFKAHTESNLLNVYFETDSPFYKSFTILDNFFSGSGSISMMVQSGEEGFFRNVENFRKVQDFKNVVTVLPRIITTESYLSSVSEIHKALSPQTGLYPHNNEELGQELLFLEFSRSDKTRDVLADFVNFDYSTAHIRVRTPNLSSLEMNALIDKVKEFSDVFLLPDAVITGHNVFFAQISNYVISTQFISAFGTLLLLQLLLWTQFGLRLSLFGIMATALPIGIVLGIIAFLGFPFDISTVVIASIAFGLSIDDVLHILHRYKHDRADGDREQHLHNSLFIPGRAIIQTSLLYAVAAATFMFSNLVLLQRFGIFTVVGFSLALLSSSILLIVFLRHYDSRHHQF